MELTAIPIKVETPTGDILYRGDETFGLSAGTRMQVRDNETGDPVNRFNESVPAGKKWSVRILLEITETDA